jgi:hypothetical protein
VNLIRPTNIKQAPPRSKAMYVYADRVLVYLAAVTGRSICHILTKIENPRVTILLKKVQSQSRPRL